MIKLTGPEDLQPLSLGKLCSFVQRALNQNILIYYKTLLIRNNQFDGISKNASSEAKNGKKVEILRDQILSLLKENRNGLSLAQIPLMLKNKYKKTYNIQSLGFPKLKNLLATMDEIELEKTQGNFLKAILKTHCRKNSDKNLEDVYKNNLAGKKFHTLRANPLDNRLNSVHYNSNLHPHMMSSEPTPQLKSYRTVSTLDDYIFKIQSTTLDIIRQNIFGIEVEKLKCELDRRLGADFHYGILKVNSFQEFLINYLGDYLDIEVKKSLKTGRSAGPLSHIVYPKNYKVPNSPKHFILDEEEEDEGEDQRIGEKMSNESPGSFHHNIHSPDLSFIHNLKAHNPYDENEHGKISQSFNIGRNFQANRLFADTLSQQAGSSVGGVSSAQDILSTKSTKIVNEYTHFGKLSVLKSSKIFSNEYKQRTTKEIKSTIAAQIPPKRPDQQWNQSSSLAGGRQQGGVEDGNTRGFVSFDNEEEEKESGALMTHTRYDLANEKLDANTVSKSTGNVEDGSDNPSLRCVEKLLLDE